MRTERSQGQTEDYFLIICWLTSSPDWTLVCDGIYKLPGMCTWQVLINFDPNEDILFLDVWQVAEKPVSQVSFTSKLMIGTSGESSEGRCDRLIHREEHCSFSDPPPMSVTVYGTGKCRQVKLVYIIISANCTVSPTLSLHYRMNLSIKKENAKQFH